MPTALGIISVATSIIGAGVSYYGQNQAAKTQMRIADYNANVQARNASMEMRLQLAQAGLAKQQLEMQAGAQQAAAKVAFQNATAMRADAEAQAALDRAEREKSRKDQLRLMATQRARVAGSGLTESGSPLAVLAESAGLIQLDQEEQAYASDLERRQRLREADLMDFSGRQGLFEAGMSRFNTKFEDLKAAGARAGYASAQTGIRLGRLQASASASAMRISATAGLLSGLGQAGGQAYTIWNNMPASPKASAPKPSAFH